MKKGNVLVVFVIILLVLVICACGIYYFKFVLNKPVVENIVKLDDNVSPEVEVKKLQIYQGDTRAIAVMIDNEKPAWPHSGLQDAYMIYEAIIEGGESRLMALFKNQKTEQIGPIRSSRHYFVHYAMEHNAIYCHLGWSPKAQSTIKNNNVCNINGLYDEYYWRKGSGYHNVYSSIKNINKFAHDKSYIMNVDEDPKYKYSADEVNIENGINITGLNLKYSNLHNVSYEYNEVDKVFYRSMRSIKDVDKITKKQYFAKNIVIMYMKNYTLDDDSGKDRQELDNIGVGTGYYLTNGKYEKITWKKDFLKSKTLWLDENNNEIVLNDGLTYVQIVPINNLVEFIKT